MQLSLLTLNIVNTVVKMVNGIVFCCCLLCSCFAAVRFELDDNLLGKGSFQLDLTDAVVLLQKGQGH